ncbi:MAG: two-component system, NarL family, sensor histidine kinase BarA [Actinomycetota bacterium]|jgi:K+-sensing histidine kinase KdpD|nr:two-component system, NarL family, sensor histidine kinase BarA [Actinomycetota bacterium]
MNRDVAVAKASPRPRLSPGAVGHLAHDLRGSIHIIRGHAELLRDEAADEHARESACYIVDSSVRLAGMCEDVIEFLGLPVIASGEPVALALDDIAHSVSSVAVGRGIQLRRVELDDSRRSVLVDPSVRRVVAHVLEHAVRTASCDVTIAATFRTPGESCVIEVWPVPVEAAENDDGIVALAAELLDARGGCLSVTGRRMELHVPLIGRSS